MNFDNTITVKNIYRQVGRYVYFVVIQIYKKITSNIVIELRKTIKKSMATGIAQKIRAAIFPLWSLRKNDVSKMKKKKYKEEMQEALKGLLISKQRKNTNKKYTYSDYGFVFILK